jgi:hypothetical protein
MTKQKRGNVARVAVEGLLALNRAIWVATLGLLQLDRGARGSYVRPERYGRTVLAGSGRLGRFARASEGSPRAQVDWLIHERPLPAAVRAGQAARLSVLGRSPPSVPW